MQCYPETLMPVESSFLCSAAGRHELQQGHLGNQELDAGVSKEAHSRRILVQAAGGETLHAHDCRNCRPCCDVFPALSPTLDSLD